MNTSHQKKNQVLRAHSSAIDILVLKCKKHITKALSLILYILSLYLSLIVFAVIECLNYLLSIYISLQKITFFLFRITLCTSKV